MRHINDQKGMALLLSILAIVVMGGLVTAAFTPTLIEQRVAENQRRAAQAFGTAEYGISESVGNWNTSTWNGIVVGDSMQVNGTMTSGIGTYTGWVHRLNTEMFVIDIQAQERTNGSRQRLAQYMKLRLLNMDIQAALTTQGNIRIGGNAEIDGYDEHPTNWNSCGNLSDMAGIRTPDPGSIDWQGNNCQNGDCVEGQPSVEQDTTVSDSTFNQFGDVDWDALISMANIRLNDFNVRIEPNEVGGACVTSDVYNWGEPHDDASPCFGYFPVIYSPGDLHISGVRGQGILVVDGNLDVQGNFEFYGIALVKGTLGTTGTGGHFNGAVMAENVNLDDSRILGAALLQFSSCSVTRALLAASPGTPIRSRGWLQAY